MVDKEEVKRTPEGGKVRVSWKVIEKIALIVAILAGLTGAISDWASLAASPFWVRIISIAGYLLSVLLILAIISDAKTHPGWQMSLLVVLFVWTGAFFLWVGTWLIPPQVVEDARSFPVERGNVEAFLYQGVDFGKGGTGNYSVASSLQNGHISIAYHVSYNLPEAESFAGVSLYFAQPIDVSGYRYLELKTRFGCPDARFMVILKESEAIFNGVTLGDGKIVDAKTEDQIVRLELSKYYPNVNHKSIRKIDFHADNTFVQGYHEFTVSDIRFTN